MRFGPKTVAAEEKRIMTANFVISEGWKVKISPTPIHRVASLIVTHIEGTIFIDANNTMLNKNKGRDMVTHI